MTITLAHSFVSTNTQGADATLVRKNDWNATHSLTTNTGVLAGRTTASDGAVEEITPSSTDFTLSGLVLAEGPGIITVLSNSFVGSNVNTAQPAFVAGQNTFTAEALTTYSFDALYHIVRSAGTTSHTTSVLFSGSATFTSIRYLAMVSNPTGNALSNLQNIVGESSSNVTLTAANTSATENLLIRLIGIMRINAAGTVSPMFQYSAAPGGGPTIQADGFFRMRKLGTNTFAASAGWA